jgi:MFS family permease
LSRHPAPPLPLRRQRSLFLLASGLSTAGTFAGLTAKGWILMDGTANPLVLALNFAILTLPSIAVSGVAGVLTDRLGSEAMLVRSQWGLFAGALLGALAIPLTSGGVQVVVLLLSSLLVGCAGSFEQTARNKYTTLLVERPEELAPYLASFAVVFNVGKLVGPPVGGWLVALTGPGTALAIDATTYLIPISTVIWLLRPRREEEHRSEAGRAGSLASAWRDCGGTLRHVLRFTALACLLGFFHPGLTPVIAAEVIGPSPQALGLFTSVIAAGSISGGLLLRRHSHWLSLRPSLLMGTSTMVTALAQVGIALSPAGWFTLAMTFLIGAGTACLLAGVNLIVQVGAPMVIRGRMAALAQISFLGAGGLSGLIAALLTMTIGLLPSFGLLGGAGAVAGAAELRRRAGRRLGSIRSA